MFLVWDERLHALTVAKALRPDRFDDERSLRELALEAELLDRLAHPVLLRGFDAVLDGQRPHLLVEHLEGDTLRRLIRRYGALPPDQLLPLAAHVAAVLHYLAGEDTVHLDVKPDNIVMGVPPRLIDLSIARTVERARRARSPLGTDAYMPPEQCAPSDHPGAIGPRGRHLGPGGDAAPCGGRRAAVPAPAGRADSADPRVRFPQLNDDPQPLPAETDARLVELLDRMVARNRAARPTAAEVVVALEPLVAELPRRTAFPRRGPAGAEPGRPRRTPWTSVRVSRP